MKSIQQACENCKQEFTPYNNRRNCRFCSFECQRAFTVAAQRAGRKRVVESIRLECEWCKGIFTPDTTNQIFCSVKCREDKKAHLNNLKVIANAPYITCEICGVEFLKVGRRHKYCSAPCRQQAHSNKAREAIKRDPSKYSEYHKNYRRRNNKAVRNYRLKNFYGMSVEQYEALLHLQQYTCAICREPHTEEKPLHIDHIHGTRPPVIRGLLCSACNKALGLFGDKLEVVAAAYWYLQQHKEGG